MSTVEITTWIRKPFVIEAVRVTSENIEAVSEWCGGDLFTAANEKEACGRTDLRYVKVPVSYPRNLRQTMAFIGDWVLCGETKSYKVYTNRAFLETYVRNSTTDESNVKIEIYS